MVKDILKLVRYTVASFLVVSVIIPSVFSFTYSKCNKSYLEEKEKYLISELCKIQESLPEEVSLLGSYTMRRHITRIVNARYKYKIDQNAMEQFCKKIMEENKWKFVKRVGYNKLNETELFFKTDKYHCNISFFREKEFRITITHDDVYSQMNL